MIDLLYKELLVAVVKVSTPIRSKKMLEIEMDRTDSKGTKTSVIKGTNRNQNQESERGLKPCLF